MDTSMLRTPLIAQTVEALVADGGGLIIYEQGMGGRETLVAAAAALAARKGSPLTIVESVVLHEETRAMVAALQPGVQCTVISARDAALQPPPAPGSVLAVHADLLRDPIAREPLLELAPAADHLLVARHDYSDPSLDSLAGTAHRLDRPAFIAAANEASARLAQTFAPTYVPPPIEQRDGRLTRQEAVVEDRDDFTEYFERKQRLIAQLNQRTTDRPPTDNDECIDLADIETGPHADIETGPHADLDLDRYAAEEEEQIAAFVERLEARARDRILRVTQAGGTDPRLPRAPAQQDQRQATAYQHQAPSGRTPGQ
ncbi:hypothetical protein GCM10010425_49290 [Streptomyces spororaveus]|uniref:Uncharacterized protein n=1 Tax=Streptomyces spororaveus TaxID=284039 RepID=A0ABQ3T2A5_9ACTN|nr:hypothetical protein [Streptomyces spororaveus]GHI74523.1 hypothetical protein Sspor_00840 [Streptomyces spororaveus]